jgi:hypothetical protein
LDAMTRRPAPRDAGRTPFGAPPRHFSKDRPHWVLPIRPDFRPPRQCSPRQRRLMGQRVVARFARLRNDQSRRREPLPAPPAGGLPEDALRGAGICAIYPTLGPLSRTNRELVNFSWDSLSESPGGLA